MFGGNAPGSTWHMTFDHADLGPVTYFVPVSPDSPFLSQGDGTVVKQPKKRRRERQGGKDNGNGNGDGGNGGNGGNGATGAMAEVTAAGRPRPAYALTPPRGRLCHSREIRYPGTTENRWSTGCSGSAGCAAPRWRPLSRWNRGAGGPRPRRARRRPGPRSRGQRLHDQAHALHAAGAGLGDRRVDQRGELVVAELGGKIAGQDVALGALGRGLVVAARPR